VSLSPAVVDVFRLFLLHLPQSSQAGPGLEPNFIRGNAELFQLRRGRRYHGLVGLVQGVGVPAGLLQLPDHPLEGVGVGGDLPHRAGLHATDVHQHEVHLGFPGVDFLLGGGDPALEQEPLEAVLLVH